MVPVNVDFGNKERGFCVRANGRDQNSGVKRLARFHVNNAAKE